MHVMCTIKPFSLFVSMPENRLEMQTVFSAGYSQTQDINTLDVTTGKSKVKVMPKMKVKNSRLGNKEAEEAGSTARELAALPSCH